MKTPYTDNFDKDYDTIYRKNNNNQYSDSNNNLKLKEESKSSMPFTNEAQNLIQALESNSSIPVKNNHLNWLIKNTNSSNQSSLIYSNKQLKISLLKTFTDFFSIYEDRNKLKQLDPSDKIIWDYVYSILTICERMNISSNDLRSSNLARKIVFFGKNIEGQHAIKAKCEKLVGLWKKLINQEEFDNMVNGKVGLSHTYESLNNLEKIAKEKEQFSRKRDEDNSKFDKFNINKPTTTNNYYNPQLINNPIIINNYNIGMNNNNSNKNHPSNSINYYNNSLNFQKPLKSILKKNTKTPKTPHSIKSPNKGKSILWEENIERFKIFKMTDEPDCPEPTEDEYMRIQEEARLIPNYKFMENMRLKEINMDKEGMTNKKDKEKAAKESLLKMIPQRFFKSLIEIYKGDEYDYADNKDSKEKLIIRNFNNNSLAVCYYKESDIPICPKMGEQKMFDFYEEDTIHLENEIIPEKNEPKIELEDKNLNSLNNINLKNFNKVVEDNNNKGNTSNLMINYQYPPHMMHMFQPPIINGNNIAKNVLNTRPSNDGNVPVTTPYENPKAKTKPCKFYHSGIGCARDEKQCLFIHDPKYKGYEIPNFNLDDYREAPNPATLQQRMLSNIPPHMMHMMYPMSGMNPMSGQINPMNQINPMIPMNSMNPMNPMNPMIQNSFLNNINMNMKLNPMKNFGGNNQITPTTPTTTGTSGTSGNNFSLGNIEN